MKKQLTISLLFALTSAPVFAQNIANLNWQDFYQNPQIEALISNDGSLQWRSKSKSQWQQERVTNIPLTSIALNETADRGLSVAEGVLWGKARNTSGWQEIAPNWRTQHVSYDSRAQRWYSWACSFIDKTCAVRTLNESKTVTTSDWQDSAWTNHPQTHIASFVDLQVATPQAGAPKALTYLDTQTVSFTQDDPLVWQKARIPTPKNQRLSIKTLSSLTYWRYLNDRWIAFGKSDLALQVTPENGKVEWLNLPGANKQSQQTFWNAALQTQQKTLLFGNNRGEIARSRDNGKSFTLTPLPTQNIISALSQSGEDVLLVFNSGEVYRSRDDGLHWQLDSALEQNNIRGLRQSHFGALAYGEGGTIAVYQNGWRIQRANLQRYMNDFQFLASGGALIVGANGLIVRADNATALAEQAWQYAKHPLEYNQYMQSLARVNDNIWLAAGSSATIVRSTDEGKSWQTVYRGDDGALGNFQRVVVHPTSGTAIAISDPGWIMRSSDQGQTWQAVDKLSRKLNDITTLSNGEFLAAGSDGTILRSRDDAKQWETAYENKAHSWNNLVKLNNHIWALGGGNTLLQFDANGENKTTHTLPGNFFLRDIATRYNGDKQLVAVGSSGSLLHSDDAGNNWQVRPAPVQSNLRKILRSADQTLWICGRDGTLLRSSDHGESWHVINTGTNKHFKSMQIDTATPQTLWLFGERLVQLML